MRCSCFRPEKTASTWLPLALIDIDLITFTRTQLLDGKHALVGPTKLRYRVALLSPSLSEPLPPYFLVCYELSGAYFRMGSCC